MIWKTWYMSTVNWHHEQRWWLRTRIVSHLQCRFLPWTPLTFCVRWPNRSNRRVRHGLTVVDPLPFSTLANVMKHMINDPLKGQPSLRVKDLGLSTIWFKNLKKPLGWEFNSWIPVTFSPSSLDYLALFSVVGKNTSTRYDQLHAHSFCNDVCRLETF